MFYWYRIFQAFDGRSEFSRVFSFAILSYSQNLRKFHAQEHYMIYSMQVTICSSK